jgi:lipopolysaccharide export system protein LptA
MSFPKKALKILLTGFLLTVSAAAQDAGMELSGFRVPEYDREGVMVSQLFGEHAEVNPGGEVKITGLRIEFYRDGARFMEVNSPYCFYNQDTREAHSDAPVTADMEKVHVSGRGFLVKPGEDVVQVLDESRVVIEDIMQQAGEERPRGSNDVTVITSKELLLAYKAKTVRFSERVHITDPQLTIDCGTLEIRIGESQEIDWIEALTDVRISHEGREARAGKAVYDIRTDEFLLEDNPRLISGRSQLAGERIRFWRANSRMVCEPSARLVIYPDDKLELNLFEN